MNMAEVLSRRQFVRDSATAAAGIAVGLKATYTVRAGNPDREDTSKILNYNPDMEYRRCGKTDLMISAVCNRAFEGMHPTFRQTPPSVG